MSAAPVNVDVQPGSAPCGTAAAGAVRTLVFDVFGTLVDWRSGVAREAQRILQPLGLALDWSAFADAWRAQYQPTMQTVRSGQQPYCSLDVLHRRSLDTVLSAMATVPVSEAARNELTLAWHRLDAWPDVAAGLARLRPHFWLAPCSNGPIALMAALARRNGLVWDAILGADLARDFKPQPEVYLRSASAFGGAPAQALMVAAHSADLAAAAAQGLRTAFIARPNECGPGLGEIQPGCAVNWQAPSLLALADQLGCA